MNDPAGLPGPHSPIDYHAPTAWLMGAGEASDVVMSSRARLARNIAGFPFVNSASRDDRRHALAVCRQRIMDAGLTKSLAWIELHETNHTVRTLLVERHLISRQHAKGKLNRTSGGVDEPRAVAVATPDEALSIMVNEEDHLRIQLIGSGLCLNELLRRIDEVDDRIEAGIDYAFSPRFGYLTACPTNVGTGIRFGVMLHLPALKLTGDIEKVKRAAGGMSLAVRGFYGEGSDASADLYQISNQTTLGKSEAAILRELTAEVLPAVIGYERSARQKLLEHRSEVIEDKVHRAIGVLTHARLLSTEEAMDHLSMIRLGIVAGLLTELEQQPINHLLLMVQPGHLQMLCGRVLSQAERRIERARLVRDRLAGVAG